MEAWEAAALELLVVVALAPGLQGLIQRVKAAMQHRHGPGVLQPYFVLAKLWRRQETRPQGSSWIFAAMPRAALATVLAACLAVPLLWSDARTGLRGDFIIVVGLLALERYVVSLAGLDTGTPFGGLGSSREVLVGALVEPALFAVALPWIVPAGGTAWPALMAASSSAAPASVSRFFGLAAALIVMVAEAGRLPVDNPDTHLELTMIHEAIVLEYSGTQLAMAMLAQMLKQLVVIAVVADLLLPWGVMTGTSPAAALLASLAALTKWLILAVSLAVGESLSVKLRFIRLPAYLGVSVALSTAAAVLQVWGGR